MKGVPLQEMVSATQNLRLAKPKLAMPIFKSTHPRMATMDLVIQTPSTPIHKGISY